jgi:plasmid stability protein
MLALVATIIIRNLDDQVAERLKIQARLKGVSLEQEARRILADGSALTRGEIGARAAVIRSRQRPNHSRAVDLVRQDRTR